MDVTLPDMLVQPVSVELRLLENLQALDKALIKYGSCTYKSKEYDSRDHHKLSKRFLADPQYDFDWLRIFEFDKNGWRTVGPAFQEQG